METAVKRYSKQVSLTSGKSILIHFTLLYEYSDEPCDFGDYPPENPADFANLHIGVRAYYMGVEETAFIYNCAVRDTVKEAEQLARDHDLESEAIGGLNDRLNLILEALA